MAEMLRVLFGVLVVASFGTIAVYVLVSVAVAASTLLGTVRRDRSADELDQVLTEILGPELDQVLAEVLGPRTPEIVAAPRRSRSARRR